MASALWLRVISHHRIAAQDTEPCTREEPEAAIAEICRRLDLPKPLWMDKNRREWQDFGQTRFLPDAFFEHVQFERLEIEFMDAEAPSRRSKDPRNAF